MTIYVPRAVRRSEGATAGLLAGSPVFAATQWSEYALNANWVRGKGACLVPFHTPTVTITSGTTRTFHYRTKTRNAAIQRVWGFCLRKASASASVTATIRAPASTGTSTAFRVSLDRDLLVPAIYYEDVASKATAEADLSFDIAASGGDIELEGISCYEQDRAALADDTTDYGVMVDTVRPRQPILALENTSAYAVMRSLANLDARRVGIYAWGCPTESPIQITSATPADVLILAAPIQVQKLNTSATTGTLSWATYAKVAAGNGKVDIALGSGATDQVTITGTSYAWSTTRTVACSCDDFGQADGLQGGTWDTLQWAVRGDGTNQLSVAALCAWFADAA